MVADTDKHAKRLGLFTWIYAGILAASVLFSIASFVYFYGSWFGSEMLPSLSELTDVSRSPYAVHVVIMILFVLGVIAAFVVMVVTVVLNIRLGSGLRNGPAPTRRKIIVASVFTLLSAVLGGILLIPFGAAVGIYGLWYALSNRSEASG